MRILFDHNTPDPLRHSLKSHTVETAAGKGWEQLRNSRLMDAAEADGFDLLITCDKGFQYEQNLRHRKIRIVLLNRGNWPDIKLSIPRILDAIDGASPGSCTIVECLMSSGTFITEKPAE
jgi:predicted nuclease of predicted toxin-antitoxin system